VLNRRGYSTGKGMRWNQTRVATARRNHSIAGQKRAGFGKTRTLAEWVCQQAGSGQASRIALVAATAADARDVLVEGQSGRPVITAGIASLKRNRAGHKLRSWAGFGLLPASPFLNAISRRVR